MLSEDDYEKIISFGVLIDNLKSVKRQCFKAGEDNENSAEHSWHIAVLLLLFKDEFKDLDFEKMISLALIHDIPEIVSGDSCPFDEKAHDKVKREEDETARDLYSKLPDLIASRLYLLQKEFNESSSKEAEIVKAMDRLQHLVQHLSTQNSAYKKWNVTAEMTKEYIQTSAKDDISKNLLDMLLAKTIAKDVFPK
jgi:putative hydrolase of HD superfamily